jgi:hypothetical protein
MTVRKYVARHLGSGRVPRVLYGTIIGLALVVALQDHPPPPGAMVAQLLGTAVAVALAEVFSEVVGLEMRQHRRLNQEERYELAADAGAVSVGIAFPAVFFLLAAAGVMQNESATTVAKWTGVGLTAFYGFAAARLAKRSIGSALLNAVAIAGVGAFLILLKSLAH